MKSKRSNKLKKTRTRTPSSESKLRYKKKKPGVVKCANCKKPLQGISKLSSAKLRNTSANTIRSRYRYGLDKLRSLLNSEVI